MEQAKIDLSKYRLEQSKQCLKSSKVLYDVEDYKGSANRSYYAIFHALRSVLALEAVDSKIGYVKVGTEKQDTICQEMLMQELGVQKVLIDKANDKNIERKEFIIASKVSSTFA